MPILKVKHKAAPAASAAALPKYHDSEALSSVIGYCTQPGKASYVGGIGLNLSQAAYEMEQVARAFDHEHGLHLRHWVLSFQPKELRGYEHGIDGLLQTIAWTAASYYGGQYQIIYAIHKEPIPHIHFVMSTTNHVTGRKYPGDKADYYAYQAFLRDLLRMYGMPLIVYNDT